MPAVFSGSTLAEAVTAATTPTNGGTVVLSGDYTVPSNLTVPSDVTLIALAGTRISISTSVTLTIDGSLTAFRDTLFTGSGTVSFGAAGSSLLDAIYPEWFGTTGAAMQAAIDAAGTSRVPLLLAQKVYNVGTTALTITKDYTVIRGVGDPVFTPSSLAVDENCAIIKYTSTSFALTIGKSVGSTATFINNVVLENLRIVCSSVNGKALDVWVPTNCLFRRIGLYNSGGSPSGSGSIGLRIRGGVNNAIDMLDINSFEKGVQLDGAMSSQLLTTTFFSAAYIHYCTYGVEGASNLAQVTFENSIIESNGSFGLSAAGALLTFNDCWLENNPAHYVDDAALTFNDCRFSHSAQYLFQVLSGGARLTFTQPLFDLTDDAPFIFYAAAGTDTNSKITFENPRFVQSAIAMAGTTYPSTVFGADRVPITTMPREHFGFIATSVGASATQDMFTTWSPSVFKTYAMPIKGQLLGVNIQFNQSISAGTYGYIVKKNGSAIITRTGLSAQNVREFAEHLVSTYQFAAGDTFSMQVTTNASFSPSGTFIAELIVAYGDDFG